MGSLYCMQRSNIYVLMEEFMKKISERKTPIFNKAKTPSCTSPNVTMNLF